MACKGGGQGVMASIALTNLSKDIKDLIAELENDIEIDSNDIKVIQERLKNISLENKKK